MRRSCSTVRRQRSISCSINREIEHRQQTGRKVSSHGIVQVRKCTVARVLGSLYVRRFRSIGGLRDPRKIQDQYWRVSDRECTYPTHTFQPFFESAIQRVRKRTAGWFALQLVESLQRNRISLCTIHRPGARANWYPGDALSGRSKLTLRTRKHLQSIYGAETFRSTPSHAKRT